MNLFIFMTTGSFYSNRFGLSVTILIPKIYSYIMLINWQQMKEGPLNHQRPHKLQQLLKSFFLLLCFECVYYSFKSLDFKFDLDETTL